MAFGGKVVVHGMGFDIGAGEKLALVGESGSGKTITALSLLRLAADAEVSGRALLQGRAGAPAQDLLALPEREMRGLRGGDIAMVFQEPMTALNPLMPVGRQIAEVLQLKQGCRGRRAPSRRWNCWPRRACRSRRGARAPIRTSSPGPAPAGDDRHGTGQPAAPVAGGRAHHRARRDAARPDPGTAFGPAAPDRHGGAAHHARPEPGAALRRPGGGDGARRTRGAGERGRGFFRARPCLHPAPAGQRTAARCHRGCGRGRGGGRGLRSRPQTLRRRSRRPRVQRACAWPTPRRCPACGAGSGAANSWR